MCMKIQYGKGRIMEIAEKTLGEKLKVLRECSGFTQEGIAKYVGVDQSMVSLVEKGKRMPSADMLEKLAALFGITVQALECEEIRPLSFALRANEIDQNDLEVIGNINRIALNARFMAELLEKEGEMNG